MALSHPPHDDLLGHFDFAREMSEEQSRNRERTRKMLLAFVEVMDSFDRFSAVTDKGRKARQSSTIALIGKQLQQALRASGVTRIASMGETAEPKLHEILGTRPATGVAEDIIVEEIACGYEWDGDILRKPRVIVAGPGTSRQGGLA